MKVVNVQKRMTGLVLSCFPQKMDGEGIQSAGLWTMTDILVCHVMASKQANLNVGHVSASLRGVREMRDRSTVTTNARGWWASWPDATPGRDTSTRSSSWTSGKGGLPYCSCALCKA
jgi:hypothetical protein